MKISVRETMHIFTSSIFTNKKLITITLLDYKFNSDIKIDKLLVNFQVK